MGIINSLASPPASANVITASAWSQLPSLLHKVVDGVCDR
eukprot:gene12195-21582_t